MPEEVKIGLSKSIVPSTEMGDIAAMITNPAFVAAEATRVTGELFTNPKRVWVIVDGIGVCAYAAFSECDPASPHSMYFQADLSAGIKSAFETVIVTYSLIRRPDKKENYSPNIEDKFPIRYEKAVPVIIDSDFPDLKPWTEPTEADVTEQFDALIRLAGSSLIENRERLEPFITGFQCGRSIAYDLLAYRHNKLVDKFNGIGEHDLDAELRELIETSTE